MRNGNIETYDHHGDDYRLVLRRLHQELQPKTYLEIGTRSGETLSLATCSCVAIDPDFQLVNMTFVSRQAMSLLYNMTSDQFFENIDPTKALGRAIDLAFLDGMHRCEFLLRDFANTERHCKANSIIALHDCLPVEQPMTARVEGMYPPIDPSKQSWWTGDIWRTALLLKRVRPDLDIVALDSHPTGLLLVTNLNPTSEFISKNYSSLFKKMMNFDLARITIAGLFDELQVESTANLVTNEQITSRFWL